MFALTEKHYLTKIRYHLLDIYRFRVPHYLRLKHSVARPHFLRSWAAKIWQIAPPPEVHMPASLLLLFSPGFNSRLSTE
jgi:hypothetical protein